MRDQVMQGLVRLPHIVRRGACGHGLNTFPFSGKKQTLIGFHWFDTISVLRGLRQAIEIGRKAFFLPVWRRRSGAHAQKYTEKRKTCPALQKWMCLFYNIVVLE
jgi:hypothetical protein